MLENIEITESDVIRNITGNSQATHGIMINNSVAMAIIKLTKRLGDNPTDSQFDNLYDSAVDFLNHLTVDDFLIPSHSALYDEIKQQLPDLIQYMQARMLDPINNWHDKVTVYVKNDQGDYHDETLILPLKRILPLVTTALMDEKAFTTDDSSTHSAVTDRSLRLLSLFRCFQRIKVGICHTGIRNELVLLLNHTYPGIELIEDPVAMMIYFLKDRIMQKIWTYYAEIDANDTQHTKALKQAMILWMTENNPSEILALADPTQQIKTNLIQLLLDNGVNYQTLRLEYSGRLMTFEDLFATLSSRLLFEADLKKYPELSMLQYILKTQVNPSLPGAQALQFTQAWILDKFLLNSTQHNKNIVDFYLAYKTDQDLRRYRTLLLLTGCMTNEEIQNSIKLMDDYYNTFRHSINEQLPRLPSTFIQNIHTMQAKINTAKQENLHDEIANFFSLWAIAEKYDNINTMRHCYQNLYDPQVTKKIILSDQDITKFRHSNTELTEHGEMVRHFTPYEINRVLLHAILIRPDQWTHLFAETCQTVLRLIREIDQNDALAQLLKLSSYTPELLAQIDYLIAMREYLLSEDTTLVRPNQPNLVFILQHQIKTADEWIKASYFINQEQRDTTYTILKALLAPLLNSYSQNQSSRLERVIYSLPKSEQTPFVMEIIIIELSSDNIVTKRDALEKLNASKRDIDIFRAKGGMSLLIQCLRSADTRTKDLCVNILSSLTWDQKNLDSIRTKDNILLLTACLDSETSMRRWLHDNEIINLVQKILSLFICDLVEYIRLHDAKMSYKALVTLQRLSQYHTKDIVAAGGIEALISTLKLCRRNYDKQQILDTLSRLCKGIYDEEASNLIVEAGGITTLATILRSDDLGSKVYATEILSRLAWNKEKNQNNMYEAGGIVALMSCLRLDYKEFDDSHNYKLSEIIDYALKTLIALTWNEINRNAIVAAADIEKLINKLHVRKYTNDKTRSHIVFLLSILEWDNADNQIALAQANGVFSLLLTLTYSPNVLTKLYAAKIVVQAASGKGDNLYDVRKYYTTDYAMKSLVKCLTSNKDAGMTLYPLKLLSLLAWDNEKNQNALREAGGIPLLIACIAADDMLAKSYAVQVLAVLASSHKDNRNIIRTSNGIVPLVECLTSNDVETKRCSAKLLSLLAWDNEENQNALREAGGIPLLIACIAADDMLAKSYAVQVLAVLASSHKDNRNIIRTSNGIVPLVECLTSNDVETKRYAISSIVNIVLYNKYSQNIVRKAGGIPLLVACLTSEDEATKHDAIQAFRHVSRIENLLSRYLEEVNAERSACYGFFNYMSGGKRFLKETESINNLQKLLIREDDAALTPKQTKVLEQSRLGQRLRAYLNNANNAEELQALCGSTPKTIIEFAHKLQNMTLTTMHTVPLDVTLH